MVILKAALLTILPIYLGYVLYVDFPEQTRYALDMTVVQIIYHGRYAALLNFAIFTYLLKKRN